MRSFTVAAVLAALCLPALGAVIDSRGSTCKCGPTDACWPSASVWKSLNTTVGGRLIKTTPIGSPCHTTTVVGASTFNDYDSAECSSVQAGWHTPEVS